MSRPLRIVLLRHTGEAVSPVNLNYVIGTWSARPTRYGQCRVWMHDPERRCWIAMLPVPPEPDPRTGLIVLMRQSEDAIIPIPVPVRKVVPVNDEMVQQEEPPSWTDVPAWTQDGSADHDGLSMDSVPQEEPPPNDPEAG